MKSHTFLQVISRSNALKILFGALVLCFLAFHPQSSPRADQKRRRADEDEAFRLSMDSLRDNIATINVSQQRSRDSNFTSNDLSGQANDATNSPNDASSNQNNALDHPNDGSLNSNDATLRPNDAAHYTNDATQRPNTTMSSATPISDNNR